MASSSSVASNSSSSSCVGSSSVQVVVRLRPMNDKEKKEGTLPVISASTSNKSVTVIKGVGAKQARSQFSFDNVFTSFSNQQDVFSATLEPVISDVLKGFETCVFAYGQTGTGKTHTMEGDLHDPDQHGVIPRSAQAIFDALDSPQYVETNVTCSYLEIYNEELSDLLISTTSSSTPSTPSKYSSSAGSNNGAVKLDIVHGGKKQGVHCRGLSEKPVHSADDVLKLIQSAAQARRVGQTRMNKLSSRSHCIFTMRVEAKRTLPDGSSVLESRGKLHLVDLAGSESAKTAELKDSTASQQAAREQERRNINKSLLTLGRVMSMLKAQSEGGNKKNKAMIPYRDSKLTRMLQEALGGRCKTVIIATISPSILNVQESLQTLHYAQTANGIKNKKAVSNSFMSVGAGGMQVEMMSSSGDNSVSIERWQEMEIRMEHMQQEVEEARQAMARNYMQHQELVDRAEAAEKATEDTEVELSGANSEIEILSRDLETERKEKEAVATQLSQTNDEIKILSTNLENEQKEKEAVIEQLSQANSEIKVLSHNLDTERKEKEAVKTKLRNTEVTLTKTTTILKATQQTERLLTAEALSLLQSLRASVADGDKLYRVVQNSRDEEVTRRSATRNYHQSVSVILDNAVSKIDNITSSEKENLTQIGELVSSDHDTRIQAIEETKSVVTKNASTVCEASSSINKVVTSDVIPKLDSLAADVKSNLESARELVVAGESELSSSCSEAIAQLKAFSKQLRDMDTEHSKIKDESMSNVEKAILETKSNVQAMLQNATTSLQAARDVSLKTRKNLNTLIQEWKVAGFSSTTNIKEIASEQQLALENSFKLLESEMDRHLSVDGELASVKEFLSKSQQTQQLTFNNQNQKISLQKRELEEALQSHESLCGQVMETVMDGVKDLVAQQLKLIVTSHSERTGKAIGYNTDILCLHDELSDLSSTVFDTVGSTNTKLESHAKTIQQTDVSVLATLDEGRKTIPTINEAVEKFQVSNAGFEKQARGDMGTLESVDDTLGDAQSKLTSNGQACVNQITVTHKTASESILQLGDAASKALTFARDDVAGQMTESIVKIEAPREAMMEQVSKNLQSIGEATHSGVVELIAQTKHNLEVITVASDDVQRSATEFASTTLALHKSQCDKSRKQISQALEDHERTIQNLASGCKEDVQQSKEQTSTFSHDVVKMDAEVPDLPTKHEIDFSEELSSTPDDIDLLEGIDLFTLPKDINIHPGSNSLYVNPV